MKRLVDLTTNECQGRLTSESQWTAACEMVGKLTINQLDKKAFHSGVF